MVLPYRTNVTRVANRITFPTCRDKLSVAGNAVDTRGQLSTKDLINHDPDNQTAHGYRHPDVISLATTTKVQLGDAAA
ncbi:hypothetical protein FRB95_004513 [Tulasnella sp. JGI-2019a]|nr:hypothetical protein FRB95_004513 [Tulasnella sp. JGI-2019a]